MEWKQFKEKYKSLIEDFNSLGFDERKKISLHSQCDVIAELIRTRNILKESMKTLDTRIITLSKILDKELGKPNN
jgi:adenylosuccinate lyase